MMTPFSYNEPVSRAALTARSAQRRSTRGQVPHSAQVAALDIGYALAAGAALMAAILGLLAR